MYLSVRVKEIVPVIPLTAAEESASKKTAQGRNARVLTIAQEMALMSFVVRTATVLNLINARARTKDTVPSLTSLPPSAAATTLVPSTSAIINAKLVQIVQAMGWI